MKSKVLTSTFLVSALLAFGVGAAAQYSHNYSQDSAQQDQTAQAQSNPGMMGGGMMGQGAGQGHGMMGGDMMSQMATHHQQMSELMNKLMQSMAAIRSEKDPEALKSKLAEHQALLDQMHNQMMNQGKNMQMMSGQMKQNCPGAVETSKPSAK
jgi:hypothetical protein